MMIKKINRLVFTIVMFSIPLVGFGQHGSHDPSDTSKVKNTIIPLIYYLPETSLAFGVAGVTTFRFSGEPKSSRASQILYDVSYTLRKQIIFVIPYELYTNNERRRFKGELGFYRFFYNYFGLGANSSDDNLEEYEVLFPRVEFNYSQTVYKNIFIGAGFKFDNFKITHIKEGGLLETEQPVGYKGGNKAMVTGLFRIDNRDNIFSSTKGFYFELFYERSDSRIGSDFNYNKVSLDLRHFQQIKPNWVFATQLYGATAGESAPFFDLPHISTSRLARGFKDRRFTNYHILLFQAELRMPIYKRLKGAIFGASSLIPNQISDPLNTNTKFTFGAGLRYVIDPLESTCLRFDLGYGEKSIAIYATVNEAF